MELEGIMLSEALTAQILQERSQRPEVACSVPEPCKARSGVQPLSTLSEVDARRSQVAQDHTAQPHWPRAGDLRVPTGGSGGSSDEQMAFGRFAGCLGTSTTNYTWTQSDMMKEHCTGS
ncbi:uncharacterized protein LOC144284463 isoform X4 [Canis aureus]